MYDLSNIFESFLPQLLTYPNPIDPLNGDAAALFLHKPEEYKRKVNDYVKKYAMEPGMVSVIGVNCDSTNGTSNGAGHSSGGHHSGKVSSKDKGRGNGDDYDSDESSLSEFSDDEVKDMEL